MGNIVNVSLELLKLYVIPTTKIHGIKFILKIKVAALIINLINFKAISIVSTNPAQIEIKPGTQFNFPNYEPSADGESKC